MVGGVGGWVGWGRGGVMGGRLVGEVVGWVVGWLVDRVAGWLVGSSHDRPSPRLNCPRGRQGADPISPFFGGERVRNLYTCIYGTPGGRGPSPPPLARVDCDG